MEKKFDFKNIGKRMPYRTPDGFFGKMQKQVLERTQCRIRHGRSAYPRKI